MGQASLQEQEELHESLTKPKVGVLGTPAASSSSSSGATTRIAPPDGAEAGFQTKHQGKNKKARVGRGKAMARKKSARLRHADEGATMHRRGGSGGSGSSGRPSHSRSSSLLSSSSMMSISSPRRPPTRREERLNLSASELRRHLSFMRSEVSGLTGGKGLSLLSSSLEEADFLLSSYASQIRALSWRPAWCLGVSRERKREILSTHRRAYMELRMQLRLRVRLFGKEKKRHGRGRKKQVPEDDEDEDEDDDDDDGESATYCWYEGGRSKRICCASASDQIGDLTRLMQRRQQRKKAKKKRHIQDRVGLPTGEAIVRVGLSSFIDDGADTPTGPRRKSHLRVASVGTRGAQRRLSELQRDVDVALASQTGVFGVMPASSGSASTSTAPRSHRPPRLQLVDMDIQHEDMILEEEEEEEGEEAIPVQLFDFLDDVADGPASTPAADALKKRHRSSDSMAHSF